MDIKKLISELMSQSSDEKEYDYTPICILKDHPDIEKIFKDHDPMCDAHEQKIKSLQKEYSERLQFLEKTHEAEHDRMWNQIYTLLKERGIYPKGYVPKASDNGLTVNRDVLYFRTVKK